MKNALLLLMLAASPLAAAEEPAKAGAEAGSCEYYLTVPDAKEAVSALVRTARAQKGIVMSYNESQVVFRIPGASMPALIEEMKKTGYITDEVVVQNDVGEELAVLRSQMKVKQEYVGRLYKLADESDLGGTLDAEREIEQVVNAIDRMKSSIRMLERQRKYADVTVTISGPSVSGRPSSYSRWQCINNLGIEYLMSGK